VAMGDSLVIGRRTDAGLRLAGLDVSPRHARIWRTRAGYFIQDLRSRQGTLVDGDRITKSPLRDGARIEIGGRQIVFLQTDGSEAPPPAPKPKPASPRAPGKTPPRGGPKAVRESAHEYLARPGGIRASGLHVVASRDSLDPLLFIGPSAFRHEAEIERLRERLRALREVGQRIATTLSCDDLLQQILDLLGAALPQARQGLIALVNPTSSELEVRKAAAPTGEAREEPALNKPLAEHVIETGLAVLCEEEKAPSAGKRVAEAPSPYDAVGGPQGTIICAPLISPAKSGSGTAIGVIQWNARPGVKFSQDDLDFVMGSASMAAAAVQTARLVDELREARQLLMMEYRRLHSKQSQLEAENVVLRDELRRTYPFEAIIGPNPRLRDAVALAQKVKDSSVSVLITGQSGTGKEMLAKAIHFNSVRALKPFVALNCAALPETLLESELFGIEKGVATGVESRMGKLELAHGGTLFLDEVADMALPTQAKLLRVLQEREFTRVGGHTPIKVDIRIIAATNKNLREAIAKCEFREELYYRLNVIEIPLPPLCERPEDILPLVNHFLKLFAKESGKAVYGFTRDAEDLLIAHAWPGNVREVRNVVQRCIVLTEPDGLVDRRLLPPEIGGAAAGMPDGASPGKLDAVLAAIERRMIKDALAAAAGNKSRAAAVLGISREGLRLKLAKYGPG
jgi:Nif-specific regulatory protein